MIRALITAALMTAAAHYFLNIPIDVALGYSVAASIATWYLWPLLRRPTRFLLRHLRPHHTGSTTTRHPARSTPTQITQINHHHYYNGTPPQTPAHPRPDITLTALPRRTTGRIASDEIIDAIIDTDGTTR